LRPEDDPVTQDPRSTEQRAVVPDAPPPAVDEACEPATVQPLGTITKHMVMLTNHGAALLFLHGNPDARVRDVAETLHVTERATARILADLRASGHLQVTHANRRNHYRVTGLLPLHCGAQTTDQMTELVTNLAEASIGTASDLPPASG
jgi:hypothetical protein